MNNAKVTTRHTGLSELWIDLGDIMELINVQEQFAAIRYNLTDNDFTRQDRAKPHK